MRGERAQEEHRCEAQFIIVCVRGLHARSFDAVLMPGVAKNLAPPKISMKPGKM
jgi:hypothetical protein